MRYPEKRYLKYFNSLNARKEAVLLWTPLLLPNSLSNNYIGPEGARAFAEALHTNRTLTVLK